MGKEVKKKSRKKICGHCDRHLGKTSLWQHRLKYYNPQEDTWLRRRQSSVSDNEDGGEKDKTDVIHYHADSEPSPNKEAVRYIHHDTMQADDCSYHVDGDSSNDEDHKDYVSTVVEEVDARNDGKLLL